MSYCQKCGAKVSDEAKFCDKCGSPVNQLNYSCSTSNPVNDTGNIGWGFLGFFFPLIGFILYLVWRNEKPKTAHKLGKGALISIIFSFVLSALFFIIGFLPKVPGSNLSFLGWGYNLCI